MPHFKNLDIKDVVQLGSALRKLGIQAQSMEEVAQRVSRHLYDHIFCSSSGIRCCALTRVFVTQPFGKLSDELQVCAQSSSPTIALTPMTKCLTLLGTSGDEEAWNDRQTSARHQATPLPDQRFVARYPMIAQLFDQLGIEIESFLEPDHNLLVDLEQKTYNVFHVQTALGSPHIPAQDEFVIPYQIESVLGFGGILPSGNVFAIILFSKVPIDTETAELFRPLALNVKIALLPFDGGTIFSDTTS